ncbi:MAG: hypothetical protein AB2L14_19995 [Candidatus Xenobiia bacterium LiM19]
MISQKGSDNMTVGPINQQAFNLPEVKTDIPSNAQLPPASTGSADASSEPQIGAGAVPADFEKLVDSFCAGGPGNIGGSEPPPTYENHWGCPQSPGQMAKEGWAAMKNAKSAEEQCYIGVQVAENILYANGASGTESAIAEATLGAYGNLKNINSAVKLLFVSLGAIAGGVQGPIGVALGRVGHDALVNATDSEEKCRVASAFCVEIARKSGDSTEQKLVGAALSAYSVMGSAGSASSLLDRVMQAMTPWSYAPFEVVMAKTAVGFIDNSLSAKDKCRVGYTFTRSIKDNSSSSSEKEFAQMALDEYAKAKDAPTAAIILRKYLAKFTEPPTFPPPWPPFKDPRANAGGGAAPAAAK